MTSEETRFSLESAGTKLQFIGDQFSWIIQDTIKALAANLEVAGDDFDSIAASMQGSFWEGAELAKLIFSKADFDRIIQYTSLRCHEICVTVEPGPRTY